ncbi:hypothetical protein AB1Y20_018724 [Prymnesium parvum]|uniref:Cyclophilin TM1367-like domain-containing protein n=1 Tax=Prymnesium parvum TaxID=97485 RepID=A0AB34JT51_PRYPA
MMRRLSSSIANSRRCARAFSSSSTNAGFIRLAFNIGATDHLVLRARVFDTPTGRSFLGCLPQTLSSLQTYGDEVYGPITAALPCTKPQPMIPPGGLAYSQQGQYLCIFYGQVPAWPVEYFAQVEVGYEHLQGGHWRDLAVSMEDPLAMESY